MNKYTKYDKKELENFLDEIKKTKAKNIAIVVRHSIRYASINHDVEKTHLTPEGKKLAFWFGTRLPKNRVIRIFHSSVKRCRQTGEHIKKGLESNGIEIDIIEEKNFISPLDFSYEKYLDKMREYNNPEKFVRVWLDDKLEKGIFRNAKKYLLQILNNILVSMKKNNKEKYLDIYITHDTNIFPIKEFILGAKHEEVGWHKPLDGIIIIPQKNNKIKIKWREYEKILDWKF